MLVVSCGVLQSPAVSPISPMLQLRLPVLLCLALLCLPACVEPARSADAPSEPRKVDASSPDSTAKEEPRESDEHAVLDAALAPEGPRGEASAFFDLPDAPLREAMTSQGIKRVERGRGGRSLGFKITLTDGTKAYFKAEQTFSAANWFGEVAAYHLDRMLGLGRVPCVVSREFLWAELVGAAGNDVRKSEVIVRDGKVRGAFVAWVAGELTALKQEPGWERWVRVKYWPSTSVTPFQRPAVWKKQLDLAREQGDDWRTKEERFRRRNLRPEPDRADRPSELSDLIVFDYLTRNLDRWGGDNANVLVRGRSAPLVFLDNGAGFEPGEPRPSLMEARLHAVQRFRRSTIDAVRAFDMARYQERLQSEPVQPVLSASQIDALAQRRQGLLDWVAEMQKVHGEAIWAWE